MSKIGDTRIWRADHKWYFAVRVSTNIVRHGFRWRRRNAERRAHELSAEAVHVQDLLNP